ncbi:MAG: hypothetical protein CSA62_05355 [Planctomycetota bacterium]|nr:MAG: hypothetical protein CSA62_05355 [Planctomycetota bacterium]
MPSLQESLREAPLPAAQLLEFALALGAFLGERHALDEHRGDLSISSIFREADGSLSLAAEPLSPQQLEREGALAPEAWDEDGEPQLVATPRAEVWQAGILLYLAISGEHPFDEDDPELRRDLVQYQDPALPGSLRPELPLEWDPILSCCLHKEPRERFANGLDLERELQQLAESGGSPRRQARQLSPKRIAALALTLIAALTLWLLLR